MIFYFLRACDSNTCSVQIVGKAINQGDGKGMKVPCKLHFAAEDSFINILKEQLQNSICNKYICNINIFSYLKQF